MKEIVYNFSTKYKQGFVDSEFDDLLKLFPEISKEKIYKIFYM